MSERVIGISIARGSAGGSINRYMQVLIRRVTGGCSSPGHGTNQQLSY